LIILDKIVVGIVVGAFFIVVAKIVMGIVVIIFFIVVCKIVVDIVVVTLLIVVTKMVVGIVVETLLMVVAKIVVRIVVGALLMVVAKIVVRIVVGILFIVVSKIVVGIIGTFSISYFFISELQIPKILRGSFEFPVLLNTENPFITDQFFGAISKNGINVARISPKTKSTILANNDAVIAPTRGEIAFFEPDNALILGSNKDLQGFGNFMRSNRVQLRKKLSKDGYVYKSGGVTPGEYKYYGIKPNYNNPELD
jgi:hypothetical protein